MAFVPPDVTTTFEDWSNGGLPNWQSTDPDGNASTLIATGGQGAVSAIGGALTVVADDDQARVIPVDTVGGTLIAYYFRWQDASNFYEFLLQGANWRLRKVVATVATDLATATGQAYNTGDKFYPLIVGDLLELYQYTGGEWNETPVLSATDSTFAAAGESALVLGDSTWRIGDILDVDTSAPTSGVTIYVDGVDGVDGRTRLQASDPGTPVETPARAAALALAGADWHDEIEIKAIPGLYDPINHRIDNVSNGAPTLPSGDNSGNEAIVVRGHTPGTTPRLTLPPSGRQLKNWTFEDLQFGEDVDSGEDVLSSGVLSRCADLTFTRCLFTGGGYTVNAWDQTSSLIFEDCEIHAPVSDLVLPSEGSGFHLGYLTDDGSTEHGAGEAHFLGCSFINIRGNDAIQAGMGAPDDAFAKLIVDGCLFHDVTEADGAEDVYHTDAIQSLGGPWFEIRNSVFIGCSDAFIASDFRNGLITIEDNLIVGAGSQLQIQGYDECVIRQNTIIPASDFGRDASIMFFTRQAGTGLRVTIENNIYGGIFYLDDSAAEHDPTSVIADNICLTDPGNDTGFGTNLPGIPEFGTSARMADLPTTAVNFPDGLPADYELANTIPNPAIGTGAETDILEDRLGRAFDDPPDVGCHQNDPGTPVSPVARAPYVVDKFPTPGAIDVARDVTPTLRFYPLPGETIAPGTLAGNAIVRDAVKQIAIPVRLTLAEPDEDGFQLLQLDPNAQLDPDIDGDLFRLVAYEVVLTTGIEDTQGSPLVSQVLWSFTTVGTGGAAIEGAAPEVTEFTMGSVPWTVGATVRVYPAGALVPGAAGPSGPQVSSAVVNAASAITFTGLQEDIRYVAFAEGRAVNFMVPSPVFRIVRVQ